MFSYSRKKQKEGRCTSARPSSATEGASASLLGFILSRTRLVERLRRILGHAQARKRKPAHQCPAGHGS